MEGISKVAREPGAWKRFDSIRIDAAAERLRGVVRRTPLQPFDSGDTRVELRLKLENRQETGAFKARGAWNQIAQLDDAQRKAGVVCASSGNHGKALAWAAQRAGVRATIVMPANAYASKVQGLTPLFCGQINIDIARATLDGVFTLSDERIFAAQKRLVRAGETVEPAGSAACAAVFMGGLLVGAKGLRVAAVVSGGNADPAQLQGNS